MERWETEIEKYNHLIKRDSGTNWVNHRVENLEKIKVIIYVFIYKN